MCLDSFKPKKFTTMVVHIFIHLYYNTNTTPLKIHAKCIKTYKTINNIKIYINITLDFSFKKFLHIFTSTETVVTLGKQLRTNSSKKYSQAMLILKKYIFKG